jgi:hypothetical protein
VRAPKIGKSENNPIDKSFLVAGRNHDRKIVTDTYIITKKKNIHKSHCPR